MKLFTNHILNLKYDKGLDDDAIIQNILNDKMSPGMKKILL